MLSPRLVRVIYALRGHRTNPRLKFEIRPVGIFRTMPKLQIYIIGFGFGRSVRITIQSRSHHLITNTHTQGRNLFHALPQHGSVCSWRPAQTEKLWYIAVMVRGHCRLFFLSLSRVFRFAGLPITSRSSRWATITIACSRIYRSIRMCRALGMRTGVQFLCPYVNTVWVCCNFGYYSDKLRP